MSDTILKSSKKIYHKFFSDRIVLYNPNSMGNPLILHKDLSVLLDRLKEGVSVKEALSVLPDSVPKEDRGSVISFLRDYGIIEPTCVKDHKQEVSAKRKESEVWLHITNNCNLQCPYCFVKKTDESLSKAGLKRFVRLIIDEHIKRGFKRLVIKFAGGEPLLEFDLIRRVVELFEHKATEQLKIGYALITNGTLFDKKNAVFFKEKISV